jgi:hypothetical protein
MSKNLLRRIAVASTLTFAFLGTTEMVWGMDDLDDVHYIITTKHQEPQDKFDNIEEITSILTTQIKSKKVCYNDGLSCLWGEFTEYMSCTSPVIADQIQHTLRRQLDVGEIFGRVICCPAFTGYLVAMLPCAAIGCFGTKEEMEQVFVIKKANDEINDFLSIDYH